MQHFCLLVNFLNQCSKSAKNVFPNLSTALVYVKKKLKVENNNKRIVLIFCIRLRLQKINASLNVWLLKCSIVFFLYIQFSEFFPRYCSSLVCPYIYGCSVCMFSKYYIQILSYNSLDFLLFFIFFFTYQHLQRFKYVIKTILRKKIASFFSVPLFLLCVHYSWKFNMLYQRERVFYICIMLSIWQQKTKKNICLMKL